MQLLLVHTILTPLALPIQICLSGTKLISATGTLFTSTLMSLLTPQILIN